MEATQLAQLLAELEQTSRGSSDENLSGGGCYLRKMKPIVCKKANATAIAAKLSHYQKVGTPTASYELERETSAGLCRAREFSFKGFSSRSPMFGNATTNGRIAV